MADPFTATGLPRLIEVGTTSKRLIEGVKVLDAAGATVNLLPAAKALMRIAIDWEAFNSDIADIQHVFDLTELDDISIDDVADDMDITFTTTLTSKLRSKYGGWRKYIYTLAVSPDGTAAEFRLVQTGVIIARLQTSINSDTVLS